MLLHRLEIKLMFGLHEDYPYFEEINEGILRCFPQMTASTKKKILDVGCGRGLLGYEIAQRGYEVWGIESSEEACKYAIGRLQKVLTLDLTNLNELRSALGDVKFDGIVFSDVLEHVYDPVAILELYKQFLTTDGAVYISVPNVANWEMRLRLLFGNFDYQSSGVMDRTHIRFFTFKNAKLLASKAGYQVVQTDFTPYLVRAFLPIIKRLLVGNSSSVNKPDAIRTSLAFKIYDSFISKIEYWIARIWRPLFSFRIILVTKPNLKGLK